MNFHIVADDPDAKIDHCYAFDFGDGQTGSTCPLARDAGLSENSPRARKAGFASTISERTAMAYDLDHFVTDCRAALTRDPGPAGREEVRVCLER